MLLQLRTERYPMKTTKRFLNINTAENTIKTFKLAIILSCFNNDRTLLGKQDLLFLMAQ